MLRAIRLIAAGLLTGSVASAGASAPVLCFSDLASGPKSGNSDNSLGQSVDQDGAIVTLWGRNLGNSPAGSKSFANSVLPGTALNVQLLSASKHLNTNACDSFSPNAGAAACCHAVLRLRDRINPGFTPGCGIVDSRFKLLAGARDQQWS